MADPFACLRIEDDEAGSSSQGEDIMQGDVLRKDYKSIPHLDSYSSLAVDDAANLPARSELQVPPRPPPPPATSRPLNPPTTVAIRFPSTFVLIGPTVSAAARG